MNKGWIAGFCFLLISLSGWTQVKFTDITATSGIDHQFEVFEGMFGGGICAFDYDNDGFEDLFLTSGMQQDKLYRNNGDGTFTDVYEGSGLEVTRHYVTQGVAGADVNKDGWVDLFLTTITSKDSVKLIPREINLFFLNNGDGTFRDATREYRLSNYNSFSTAAAFGDVNQDGYIDLYVGNYFLAYEGKLSVISDATIVGANQTSQDYLLINKEGKYFVDAYEEYDLDHRGFGFGGVFTDYDNDGDIDIIVNNDFGYKAVPNYLLRNDYPRRRFTDVTEEMEMDLKINSMGTAVGDYNEDGILDYFFTNIRWNWFMTHEQMDDPFEDVLKKLKMNVVTISWGANFADFDQDGDVDLFVGNGDLNPNCVPMANFYYENEGAGGFTDMAPFNGMNHYGMARGSVAFDLENDGDLDLIVV
ncbi:MAG: VCBS repeat-containing protein, partial [Bacteroidota bacterium]